MTDEQNDPSRRSELKPLIASLTEHPALVFDRYLTVIESNRLAERVAAGFAPGSNLVRAAFFTASSHGSSEDLTTGRAQLVGLLKDSLRRNAEDAGYLDLIGELVARSAPFAVEWAKQPASRASGELLFAHPAAGVYSLSFHLLGVGGPSDDTLVIWRPSNEHSRAVLERLTLLDQDR